MRRAGWLLLRYAAARQSCRSSCRRIACYLTTACYLTITIEGVTDTDDTWHGTIANRLLTDC